MTDDLAGMNVIGVVGAGEIGASVAHQFALFVSHVILLDVCDDALRVARSRILQSVRLQRMLSSATCPAGRNSIDRICFTKDVRILSGADLIIENVTEDATVKRDVYCSLDLICPPKVIFAANTSAIPISTIASYTARPSDVVGMHFMNPVPQSRAVEIIRGPATSEQTLEIAVATTRALGKEAIVVNDSAGFVSNRTLMLMINEAIATVADGVAPPADVDRVFRECFGHPMGPLETADLIGLDTVLRTLKVLAGSYGGCKFNPSELLTTMVSQGRNGRKSSRGFYDY